MTDEQINAAIAEACGLKKPCRKVKLNDKGFFVTQHAKLPNYCTDLNAMHEAESVLTEHQNESIYPRNLGAWRNPTKPIYATARQRAEAFLRTLGKWEETE
jgi:hypothetical protein